MQSEALYDTLNSVTAIPIVPYKGGVIDLDGHRKNIRYLMENNHLDGNRKRVIGIAGTSLIHHFSFEDQMRVIAATGEEMGEGGFLMSGIVPNPISQAEELVRGQSVLPRPPDVYLIMPLTGVADHEATYDDYMAFAERLGTDCGARFLLYMRSADYVNPIIRLVRDSPHMVGVKVGTSEEEVAPLIEGIGDDGIVMWGIGDRSTRAAEMGARGHTSGIAIVAARAADEINNAQRRGDLAESSRVEALISDLEHLRFMNGRQYNYSAVIEAMIIGGWEDVAAGEGGPFNPRVPRDIADRVAEAVEPLRDYH
ncbi:MAG: dihydrodipicolinate synthase family protein [Gemmatimonadetes bacterium]|nr:dihydrodipicolinate synthase family protein [Gemmatimonadota bacterium]